MSALNPFLNRIVTAFLLATVILWAGGQAVQAQDVDLDVLFADLADPQNENWEKTEDQIRALFRESGSESMNFLLERGYAALSQGDLEVAVEHFTALTDHAPDFAEGYNGRATTYFNLGMYGPSVSDIATVLSLEPRHFGAIIGLARILEDSGKPKQALEVYQQVALIHPNQPQVAKAIARLSASVGGTNL
ncbi:MULTISPECIES: tetratricopeptide repeat protein [Falsihalocynthiibacter]|uniref:tetratricopeptide repeat protein n=1 Tax=Falsihalocynthiibacter TaxID=2854182 RepID=UPI0030018DEC